MQKFRLQQPYNSRGKSNFRYTEGKSGIYMIYRNGVLRYVGMSRSNVYKTMHRHFQSWDDSTQIRISYPAKNSSSNYQCRVILCSPGKAEKLERLLILKYKPIDNPYKFAAMSTVTNADNKLLAEFVGTPVESCPF